MKIRRVTQIDPNQSNTLLSQYLHKKYHLEYLFRVKLCFHRLLRLSLNLSRRSSHIRLILYNLICFLEKNINNT